MHVSPPLLIRRCKCAGSAGGLQCRNVISSTLQHRRCDRHRRAPSLYEECKAACDAYFYLPARREHRGVGGIFFDDLAAGAGCGVDPEAVREGLCQTLKGSDSWTLGCVTVGCVPGVLSNLGHR